MGNALRTVHYLKIQRNIKPLLIIILNLTRSELPSKTFGKSKDQIIMLYHIFILSQYFHVIQFFYQLSAKKIPHHTSTAIDEVH